MRMRTRMTRTRPGKDEIEDWQDSDDDEDDYEDK